VFAKMLCQQEDSFSWRATRLVLKAAAAFGYYYDVMQNTSQFFFAALPFMGNKSSVSFMLFQKG
jgi:hypothetical protein